MSIVGLNAYGYKQNLIDNVNFINLDSDNFYNYKGLNFLSKLSIKNNILVINFHGAVRGFGKERIIFRGFNYSIENTDIVCISDFLMNKYDDYQVNWCLSSAKHNAEIIYKELFNFLIKSKPYKEVIFTGSSAGGYPSLYFASYYNKIAIFSNPQLYLEKYGYAQKDSNSRWGFYKLAKMLADNGDAIIYEPKTIENHLMKYKPKKIIIYNNKLDTHTYKEHVLPFVNFLEEKKLNGLLELNIFEGPIPPEGKTNHEINFPTGQTHLYVIKNYIKSLETCKK